MKVKYNKGNEKELLTYDDIVPLIELERQVSVGLDPLGIGRVHNRLRRGADGNRFGQVAITRLGDPGHLGSKVGDVCLLLLQCLVRHEHGEVTVLDTQLLNLAVKEILNRFPNSVGPRAKNVASADIVVFNHFSFRDHLYKQKDS